MYVDSLSKILSFVEQLNAADTARRRADGASARRAGAAHAPRRSGRRRSAREIPAQRTARRRRTVPRAESDRVRPRVTRSRHDRTCTDLTLARAQRGPARTPLLQRRADAALPRAHRALQSGAERLHHRDGRAGARRCAKGRSAARGRRGAAARRPAARAQGHLLHRRRAHDLRLADAVELRRAVRRDRRRAPVAGRRRHARQDEHGRVRDGLVERDQLVRAGPQPVGPEEGAGRLVGRLGSRRRGAPCARSDRHRHGRLDPPACGAHGADRASSRPTAACRATE